MKPYYRIGDIVIYHGDCLTIAEWRAADLIVTDPPYGIGWRQGANPKRNSYARAPIAGDEDTTTRDRMLDLIPGRPAVVFGSWYAPFPANLKQVLVYAKPPDAGLVGSTTGYRRDTEPIFLIGEWPIRTAERSSLIRSSIGSLGHLTLNVGHPHAKPADILLGLIASAPGHTIADPFMGSGSTLVAAKRLGRPAIGVDVDEAHCERAARRLDQGVFAFGTE